VKGFATERRRGYIKTVGPKTRHVVRESRSRGLQGRPSSLRAISCARGPCGFVLGLSVEIKPPNLKTAVYVYNTHTYTHTHIHTSS
jgi:hypothetical protein